MTLNRWPLRERPRERLLRVGSAQLSDTELLAIMMRCGAKDLPVLELAGALLSHFKSLRGVFAASCRELCVLPGVGPSKYCELQAAMEICRRQLAEPLYERSVFNCAEEAKYFLRAELRDLQHEVFGVLMLNSQHQLIMFRKLFSGTINAAAVYPREIVKQVLADHAAAVILVHNHPSGNATPSQADIRLTSDIKHALALVDVIVLDHFIVADNQVISLAQQGVL
ncbi:RadC family protein [Alteromonas gilva]|uniref:DNA repair protein RadC n=1 Tax=Alteromonas gilva TaxID=2987522 RepID=A0ABT5L456_9ALTE|nr:DNA repair protein RadC [Alteromonas gilva]MDC8831828.1 DNA repair protein RadC [Alteromonas gilva]